MENRLKQLHECYMHEKRKCTVATESPGHQEMMKNIIVEMVAINKMMDTPEHYDRIQSHYERDHCPESVNRSPLSREEAHEWVAHMKATGGVPWNPWTIDQTTKLLSANGVKLGALSDWCANALLNMLWSDNPTKTPDQVVAMAKEYVSDPDTVPAGEKLGIYYRYIAKH